MTIVVVDTNLMCQNPDLSGANWSEIIRRVEARDIRVMVPEVVIREVAAKIRSTASDATIQAARLPLVQAGLFELAGTVREHLERRSAEAEAWFRTRVEAAGFEIADWPTVSHAEVARRAAERIAPYARTEGNSQESAGNTGGRSNRRQANPDQETSRKDGYRDTLIWFTVLEIASRYQREDVWFVSENYKDFGDVTSEEKCPAPWHPDLASELESTGRRQTFYARSLAEFQSHLVSAINPLGDEELAAAQARLDLSRLQTLLDDRLYGFPADPWEAGFPKDVEMAAAIAGIADNTQWEFTEAGTRFGGGWTARFSVPAQVDIVAPREELDTTVPQLVRGTVWVDRDDTADMLEVSGLELLPGQHPRSAPRQGALGSNIFEMHPSAVEEVLKAALKDYWGTEAGKQSISQVTSTVRDDPEYQKNMQEFFRRITGAVE
ncbi:DUF4935 domain-containing protein [Nocardia puris]|uniref:PIN domain-containing protein n=1 Tax=Nocardia puris TaxID=208602 RepID=UPI0018940F19|nr:PIN domain-containing protein [Nocardia puris]MBF6215971.1 DUF4935 domain-containing protein [Nocardia puris]